MVDWGAYEAIAWGHDVGLYKKGAVVVAELSPSLRCPETCSGCPDSSELTQAAIRRGEIPTIEPRASQEDMLHRVSELHELGVSHVMNIGGTIDHLPELRPLIERQLELGMVVSWFTDGIPQLTDRGQPTKLLEKNLEAGWLSKVATHVSTDYPYGYGRGQVIDLFNDELELPSKKGRVGEFRQDPEYSRVFKSQYGAILMMRLIEAGARRVVANMTISKANFDQIGPMYNQAVALQDYAHQIDSPTEVLFTFSPWVWRPHQARGDNPSEHSPNDAVGHAEMPAVNRALSEVLNDTYERVAEGRSRILANSSGYTSLHAERAFQDEAVLQDVGYPGGRPLILNVSPTAELNLDPMFKGPELAHVKSTFGYMDRTYKPSQNPFSRFHHGNRLYLPNLIALENRQDPQAQPLRTMDYRAAHMVVKRGAILFGENLRNKEDSPHTMGDPRLVGSDPFELRYLAERILHIAQTECEGNLLTGIVSYGLGLAAAAAVVSVETSKPMRFNYLKLVAEEHKGKKLVEGDVNLDDYGILVDDLVFHGTSTRVALENYKKRGFRNDITDLIYFIDRQLQRTDKGPSLVHDGYRLHRVLTMDEIVQYMIDNDAITPQQLEDVIHDYRLFERHDLPPFAQ